MLPKERALRALIQALWSVSKLKLEEFGKGFNSTLVHISSPWKSSFFNA